MGSNLGAVIAPLVGGRLGEKMNWDLGLAAGGIGMACGVLQYALGGKYLGNAGRRPNAEADAVAYRRSRNLLAGAVGLAVLLAAALITGVLPITAQQAACGTTFVIVGIALASFAFHLAARRL